MKIRFYLPFAFLAIFLSNSLFAEVSDESFNELNNRIQKMEEVLQKLDGYYQKVDNIENDLAGLTSGRQASTSNEFDDRLKNVESAVNVLEDRSSLFDFSDEFRRQQEYVCENGHVLPVTGDGNLCPVCGARQRSNTAEKVFKYARRENIAGRIAAAFDEEFAKLVSVGISGTGIFQQILASDEEEDNYAQGSFDITFITKPLPNAVFFVDLEAIGGDGPDESIGSFSGLNADSGTFQDDDGVDRISVREAWMEAFFFNEMIDIVAGKIDLGNYFDANDVANDETSQFFTDAFVNNPTMEPPDQGPGIVAFFDAKNGLRFGVGLQSADDSGSRVTDDIYAIAELDYTTNLLFDRDGTYRIWVRTNGGSDDNKGFGISFDQNLTERVTAFARYGGNEHEDGDTEIASAWSAGMRLASPLFSRPDDEVAVAFGMIDIAGGDEESSAEVYYKFQFNDHFAISPNLQAVFDPAGVGAEDTVMAAGIRTQIDF